MFFTQSLSTFSPKNRAWKKLVDWIRQYEHILIKDECSLDAMKAEIESKNRGDKCGTSKTQTNCF